jgi:Domain of unknown function (DUF4349)
MTRHDRPRSPGLPMLIVLLALALAGCAQAGSGDAGAGRAAPAADEGAEDLAGGAAGLTEGAAADGGGTGQDGPTGELAPIEQRIVKTGEVGLVADDVMITVAQVRALAVELGGYVGGSQAGTAADPAMLTLRVPAEQFDELLTRLGELSDVEVVSTSSREQDVTGQIVDLGARIRNLEASEASYRVLLDRAERIEDVITVQGRLDEVRGEIEQLEGQLEMLETQADLSTLTVTVIPRDEPVAAVQAGWDPSAQVKDAAATLVGLAQGVLAALIWLVIVIVPISVIVGLVALVAIRLAPEVRRRVTPSEAEATGEGPGA